MHRCSVSGQLPRQADQGETASSVKVDDTRASDSSVTMRSQMFGCVVMHVANRLRLVLPGCVSPLVPALVLSDSRYNCYAVAAPS